MIRSVINLAARAARVDRVSERRAQHDFECVYRSQKRRLARHFGARLAECRVLDFGCGYRYPNVVLLSADVREMVGVDVAPLFRDGWQLPVREHLSRRKVGTALESAVQYAESARYYRHLERIKGTPVRHEAYRVVRYQGDCLPFEDGSFDCVISNAVLQELPLPLERFAREIARVLKPGGFIDLEWHNFYSLTGNYRGDEASRREPWGHLLGGFYHPDLNRVTPPAMVHAFEPWFEALQVLGHDRSYRIAGEDDGFEAEGKDLLTPELSRRLEEYPREWLLTRGYVLQGVRNGVC
jgi:SAM-dependent methyltransferase